MVEETKLSEVLSEFARVMLTDFSIEGILDRLVHRVVDLLPVTSAGVALITPTTAPRFIAASDEAALRYEQLQTDANEGPCIAAYDSGVLTSVPSLVDDGRFPVFAAAALASGLRAVFAFPLRHGQGRFGALDLYRDVAGPLDSGDLAAAQTLADVAAVYILMATARADVVSAGDRYQHAALHDSLTGLANRLLFDERLAHAAQRARRSQAGTAVLFADIDRFKLVNDTYGHHVGDRLLIAVAARLAKLIRSGDTLARLSGDEFVVLCEDLKAPGIAEALAQRISDEFDAPFSLDGLNLHVTASVGIAYSGPGQGVSRQLLSDADLEMYRVKRQRRPSATTIVDVRRPTGIDDQGRFESDLRAALLHGQLSLAYQPIVDPVDRIVIGVEALVRWNDPHRGDVPALTIIGAAERSALINDIGRWVLRRACSDHRGWSRRHRDLRLELSVNLSAREIASPAFAETVADVLHDMQMDPSALILEVTETLPVGDDAASTETLLALRRLGVRLALDDFGTGASTIDDLQRLPVQIVKIDQRFIARLAQPDADTTIVSAVTALAHQLGMKVVAEGIEHPNQHDHVTDIGCDHAQGYLYARPMSSADLADYLEDCQMLAGHGRH